MEGNEQGGFIAGFNRAAKEPIRFPRYPYIDEYPTFLSWPFVWLLAKRTRVGPEFIALTGFFARLGVAAGIVVDLDAHRQLTAALLAYAILSDCADGQMARYCRQVSSLGALYDLTSDFAGSVAIFLAVSLHLARTTSLGAFAFALGALALSCYFCACSAWGFVRKRQGSGSGAGTALAESFLSPPLNDGRRDTHYQAKFKILQRLFMVSWLPFARVTLALPVWKDRVRHRSLLHVHALGSLNVHWTVLLIVLLLDWPAASFLWYEVLAFLGLVLWIALTEVELSRAPPLPAL
jgi:phosphatidylglycerophosphate synthase